MFYRRFSSQRQNKTLPLHEATSPTHPPKKPAKQKSSRLVISEEDVLRAVFKCIRSDCSHFLSVGLAAHGEGDREQRSLESASDSNVLVGASLIAFTLITADGAALDSYTFLKTFTTAASATDHDKIKHAFSSRTCCPSSTKDPTEERIYNFFCDVLQYAGYTAETTILALVLIIRLWKRQPDMIHGRNWPQVLLTALIIGQKLLDDVSLENADFAQLHCLLWSGDRVGARDITQWEVAFLQGLDYRVHVTGACYHSCIRHILQLTSRSYYEGETQQQQQQQQQQTAAQKQMSLSPTNQPGKGSAANSSNSSNKENRDRSNSLPHFMHKLKQTATAASHLF